MNNKIYEIKISDWEEVNSFLFTNVDNVSEEQFIKEVRLTMSKYGKEFLDQEKQWIDGNKWVTYIIPMLEKDFGYKLIQPEVCEVPNQVDNPSEYFEGFTDKSLIDRAIKHNEELDRKSEEEFRQRVTNEPRIDLKEKMLYLFLSDETFNYSDIAEKLGLSLKVVVDICNELEAEGKIKLDDTKD